MNGPKDDARRKILARRAAFVAAALAGVGSATADCTPRPCLEPPLAPDADRVATADAGGDATSESLNDAGALGAVNDAASADAEPRPCLSLVALEDGGLDGAPRRKPTHLKPKLPRAAPCLLVDLGRGDDDDERGDPE